MVEGIAELSEPREVQAEHQLNRQHHPWTRRTTKYRRKEHKSRREFCLEQFINTSSLVETTVLFYTKMIMMTENL